MDPVTERHRRMITGDQKGSDEMLTVSGSAGTKSSVVSFVWKQIAATLALRRA